MNKINYICYKFDNCKLVIYFKIKYGFEKVIYILLYKSDEVFIFLVFFYYITKARQTHACIPPITLYIINIYAQFLN